MNPAETASAFEKIIENCLLALLKLGSSSDDILSYMKKLLEGMEKNLK